MSPGPNWFSKSIFRIGGAQRSYALWQYWRRYLSSWRGCLFDCLLVFYVTISLFLVFVMIATPNQYNNKNGIPGIKNRNKTSNPFGIFIWVMKTTIAETIPNKPNIKDIIGLQILICLNLYRYNESQITNENWIILPNTPILIKFTVS